MSVALVPVAAGCLLAVACVAALFRLPDALDRLHAVTPVTSLAAPLIMVGLAVHDGTFHGVAKFLLGGLVLFVTGPVIATATARAARTAESGAGASEGPTS